MPHQSSRHAYKEIQLQQLRSFCETARLGSLTAAARALGLAQPTVWEQVHALERALGVTLIERHARGCRLTDSGRRVADLAAPLVQGVASFQRTVREALGQGPTQLTLATTQRILVEDLPETVVAFEQEHPHVQLRLLELRIEQVPLAVEAGEADLGLTTEQATGPQHARLRFEPAYQLDLFLITPRDHPLARRRHVEPRDLLAYPLVNAPQGIPDPTVTATLDRLGAFQVQPRRVEAFYTAVIRRYVELGFGIGLIVGLPSRPPSTTLHERSMSRHFGHVTVNLVLRKGEHAEGPARAFAQTLGSLLNDKRTGKKPR
jgi:molybdate transport repressor ModE-like protein